MSHDNQRPGDPTSAVDWERVWVQVAGQLTGYRDVGLEALLTEDVLRFSTIQQLTATGVDPRQLEVEWRRPGVPDAVDLVINATTRTALEFKFPREPRETNAAWTQHLGEALKDFYRLATMPPDFVRTVVRAAAISPGAPLLRGGSPNAMESRWHRTPGSTPSSNRRR